MTAILFGSIGTLADTSELQREAFNAAFAEHGLDWDWSQADYQELLTSSGGRQRVADYADSRGEQVDADAVHATKSQLFQKRLGDGGVEPRPDIVATIEKARSLGVKVGLITTTSPENIGALTAALSPAVDIAGFDLVLDLGDVDAAKPAGDVYALALQRLGEDPSSVVAIEDNVGGVASAVAAGVSVIAFPGENNAAHDFSAATRRTERLSPDDLPTSAN